MKKIILFLIFCSPIGGWGAFSQNLDVIGDFNTKGKVKVNGNAGTAGQVLTSNGAAAPTWNTLVAPLTTAGGQFFIDMQGVSDFNIASNAPPTQVKIVDFGSVGYNTNADVTIDLATNRINFNRTGLYEFEGIMTYNMVSTQAQNASVSLNFVKSGTSRPYQFTQLPNTIGTTYSKLINFKFMHRFNAGEFLTFTAGFFDMDTNPAVLNLTVGQFAHLFGRFVAD